MDQLIEHNPDGTVTIVMSPREIASKVCSHFQAWMTNSLPPDRSIPNLWSSKYKPIDINPQIMNRIADTISMEELMNALS